MDDNQIERLKAEWDQEKNAPLRFEDVTPGSDRKVWWRCDKGHSWPAKVSNRFRGTGCLFRFGTQLLRRKENDKSLFLTFSLTWKNHAENDKSPEKIFLLNIQ